MQEQSLMSIIATESYNDCWNNFGAKDWLNSILEFFTSQTKALPTLPK